MTAPQDDEFGPWQLHDGEGWLYGRDAVSMIAAKLIDTSMPDKRVLRGFAA